MMGKSSFGDPIWKWKFSHESTYQKTIKIPLKFQKQNPVFPLKIFPQKRKILKRKPYGIVSSCFNKQNEWLKN
jgi:hypothetical protein